MCRGDCDVLFCVEVCCFTVLRAVMKVVVWKLNDNIFVYITK